MRTRILILLILSLFISSCGIGNNSGNKENDAIIVNSENSGVLNLGIESIDTLNPLLTSSASVYQSMQLVFESLFSFDEALNSIGVLAQSCVASEDGYRYTIKLKEGIKWHDGSKLLAVDVLHTINLIRYNETPFTQSISCISSVTTVDNYTLVIGVSRPVPNFTALLTFPIVKQSVTLENPQDYIPVGTGPYKYDGKITAGKIGLSVNENWQGTSPAIKEIHLNILKDKNSLADAFNASEIDVVTSDGMDLNSNTPRGEITTNDYITNNMIFLGINNTDSILSGANTRKALSYLIDKNDIVTTEIFSRAAAADLPVNPSAWYYPKVTAVEYQAEYITEVLALDGWNRNQNDVFIREKQKFTDDSPEPVTVKEELKVEIIVNDDNEERFRIASKIGDVFNNFGINTEITLLSFEDYSLRISEKNYQLFIGELIIPYNMDQYSLLCDSGNYFSYNSQAINDAVYRLGTANSTEETRTAFSEYMKVFNEEMPFVPLFFRKESVIFEKALSGTSMPTMFNVYNNPQNWYLSTKSIQTEDTDTSDKSERK